MNRARETVFKIIDETSRGLLLRIYVDGEATGTAKAYPDPKNRGRLTVYPHRMEYPYSCTLTFPMVVWRQNISYE